MKKIILIVLAVLMLAGVVLCILLFARQRYTPVTESEAFVPSFAAAEDDEAYEGDGGEETGETADETYVSPVDFDALQAINDDIYGWLDITGTDISLPVVQHDIDDTYYLTHDSDGNTSANGALFSESYYNAKSFVEDPVVILYGHHMASGSIFGNLQQYFTDSDYLSQHEPIMIYTPKAAYEYQVFAALPYSNEHILYANDMEDDEVFTAFFDEILSSSGDNVTIFPEYAPEVGDHVLILSTCLSGNNINRFLVMATMQS